MLGDVTKNEANYLAEVDWAKDTLCGYIPMDKKVGVPNNQESCIYSCTQFYWKHYLLFERFFMILCLKL